MTTCGQRYLHEVPFLQGYRLYCYRLAILSVQCPCLHNRERIKVIGCTHSGTCICNRIGILGSSQAAMAAHMSVLHAAHVSLLSAVWCLMCEASAIDCSVVVLLLHTGMYPFIAQHMSAADTVMRNYQPVA